MKNLIDKFKWEKGFTLIELIVVIAVIGILVLLALPNILGKVETARLAQIKNDIKTHENSIESKRINESDFIENWGIVNIDELNTKIDKNEIYNKKGKVKSHLPKENYYKIPVEENIGIKTKLKGSFYVSQDGLVYYENGKLDSDSSNNEGNVEADENDFVWIEDVDNFHPDKAYVGLNGKKGYFKYKNSGKKVLKIPNVIQGVPMTSYFYMFEGLEIDDFKVISDNENIVDLHSAFYMAKIKSLDLSKLNVSNVRYLGSMFYMFEGTSLNLNNFKTPKALEMNDMFTFSTVQEADFKDFDTSNVKSMYATFSASKFKSLDLRSFDTSNVTNMKEMFLSSYATSYDLSSFNTSNVTNMYLMFGQTKAKYLDLSTFTFDSINTGFNHGMNNMFYNSALESGLAKDDYAKSVLNNSRTNVKNNNVFK